jgi:hypothetical protein
MGEGDGEAINNFSPLLPYPYMPDSVSTEYLSPLLTSAQADKDKAQF